MLLVLQMKGPSHLDYSKLVKYTIILWYQTTFQFQLSSSSCSTSKRSTIHVDQGLDLVQSNMDGIQQALRKSSARRFSNNEAKLITQLR